MHWTRMKKLLNEMVGIGGKLITYPIVVFILSISHYAFASMHTGFEVFMFIFHRKQFKMNMVNLENHMKNSHD